MDMNNSFHVQILVQTRVNREGTSIRTLVDDTGIVYTRVDKQILEYSIDDHQLQQFAR